MHLIRVEDLVVSQHLVPGQERLCDERGTLLGLRRHTLDGLDHKSVGRDAPVPSHFGGP